MPSPTHTLPPLPTNTAIPIAPPTTIPEQITEQATAPGGFFRSCQEILENGQSQGDDYYTIDADGSEGRLDPFEVYCDMTQQGGGWTLFAYHTDGIRVREVPEVTISETGVIQADRWRALRNNMTTGMMFIDELGKVSAISAKDLNDGSCQNIQNPSSLLPPSGASKQLWHDEMRGCNGTGQDYSVIMLQGPAYENYGFSGAALYQYSELKFDPWPYNNKSVSYSEQNELFYYIK
ncbi:MAG: hypothetical protein HC875_41855 [Anaerolineales bacterium]|nr:hypothetical protein [Anaerolineales bacterium]